MEVEKRIMVNGGMKLPVGYRFHPTEQELILHYLLPKALASPLPSSIIPVFDDFFSHPLTFPGDQEERQRYFFCKKKQEVSGNAHRIKTSSGDGYWKAIRKEREVIARGRTVGIRRTLVFYGTNNSSANCNKTRWCMTEYSLAGFASTKVFGEWAVYKVYKRKESKGRRQRISEGRDHEEEDLNCIHFTIGTDHETCPPPPSPPTSADESGSII
ncbi:NAC domain containing protein 84 [Raphanus sativus]|uniref:NAC domain-containing protein 41 n=1 Tax=Raphanus sativus TaxID=3726 RepID=A0A6J0M3J7_RAPSA|nr:NAC domain-containing protein 41 [Raphanus sativus]KAJ4908408.1 NAC domain containing protein 84 [Raphanus sativus]